MKVLFALGNEQTSKRVAERYYNKYGEELDYKNVFYFKALLEEVKNTKTYDRIVISEDLEQFHVKNLESLDKFIFKNVDNVTDEIEDSEVIFICSDRRSKQNDRFVEKLFNIGVYNTLIGDEREVETLCDYIKKPHNKKEAKRHLNITSVVSDGEISSSDDTVEEVQIMNILKYYDNIKGKRSEYLPTFDKISEQYSRNQLKVIINFLPPDVKVEVLSSPKYSFLIEGIPEEVRPNLSINQNKPTIKHNKKGLFGILKENKNRDNIQKQPDVIVENDYNKNESGFFGDSDIQVDVIQSGQPSGSYDFDREQAELKARAEREALEKEQAELKARAEKESLERKQQAEFEITEQLAEARRKLEQEKLALEEEKRKLREQSEKLSRTTEMAVKSQNAYNNQYTTVKVDYKKMVVFVGANKSGTTFMVNAVAHNLANSNVVVGILDMAKDKNLYYIYNQDDKNLRNIASECMQKLGDGVDSYIPVSKNLKVYTTIPGSVSDTRRSLKNKSIIEYAKEFNNLVIVDADFSTPIDYYEKADEIYIVQDLDIMKLQETTLFLRELKSRSINLNKVKIIINKYVKSLLTPKRLIQGLSYYNDPQMSFTDELLDSKVPYYIIPFSLDNYINYIDGLYKTDLNYKKYSADFLNSVSELSKNVFKRVDNVKKKGFFG